MLAKFMGTSWSLELNQFVNSNRRGLRTNPQLKANFEEADSGEQTHRIFVSIVGRSRTTTKGEAPNVAAKTLWVD